MSKFFITNAIPYVNAKPHVGHALEFVQSDVIKRYHSLIGDETLLLCGGDENAIKNVQAAEQAGIPIQEFIDKNSNLFLDLAQKLNVHFDIFQKGSDKKHHASSQKLWNLCFEKGDIYKKEYVGLYCVGCELFYEKDELNENGECFEHPGKKLEEVREENYFFKLSTYQKKIEKIISSNIQIIPESRKNEVLSFVKQGLQDISISRSNKRAKNWGVPVPNDPTQILYVWFDALNIYQSGIGFGWDEKEYQKWWPADVHVIGKGITRFHAVYWPAFLLSAGLSLPKSIFVHGYFTVDGQKMSKTLGNVVDPVEMIEKYGTDALRYYFLREIPSTGDGDFSEGRLREVYTADLANGLGNLVARVAKLCEKVTITPPEIQPLSQQYFQELADYKFNEALALIWADIRALDQYINQEQPWKVTRNQKLTQILQHAVEKLAVIANKLQPFLPATSETIRAQLSTSHIKSAAPLFPRLASHT